MATITTLKSGDDTDTSVWSSGTVPVEGDKVTISKRGTATSRTLSAGVSEGATSIPISAGTGTILLGETVQFDGDEAYYTVTTGVTASAGTLVITPGVASDQASGATIRNRGDKVRLTANRTWGDDTTTGVNVNGVLYWTRANDATLTCKGTYTVSPTGTEDRGRSTDKCDTYVSGLKLNYSAVLAANKYTYAKTAGGRIKHYGKTRTRATRTTAAVSASATSIQVESAIGWAVNDVLLVLPTTPLASRLTAVEQVTVTSVSGTTVGISALVDSKLPGAYVLNLTSNVITGVHNTAYGSTLAVNGNSSALGVLDCDLFESSFDLKDAGVGNQAINLVGNNVVGAGSPFRATRCVFAATSQSNAAVVAAGNVASISQPELTDSIFVLTGSGFAVAAAGAKLQRCAAVGVPTSLTSTARALTSGVNNTNPSVLGDVTDSVFCGYGRQSSIGQIIAATGKFSGNEVFASASDGSALNLLTLAAPGVTVSNNDFDPYGTATKAPFTPITLSGDTRISGTHLTAGALLVYGAYPGCRITSTFSTGRSAEHEFWDDVAYGYADSAQVNAGTSSMCVVARSAVKGFAETLKSAFSPGSSKRVVGYLRRDSLNGVSEMPKVTLSAPGLTSVSSSVPDVSDAWHKVDLTLTNTTANTLEISVELYFLGNGGACWFDGIPVYPFVQLVRHYGFTFDESNPFRTVDSTLTLTEAQAAALSGVAINHGTQTITVTAARTAAEVYCYAVWDLCQTANLTKTRHITSSDGASFTTTYTVVLSGAGAISGRYSDANGAVVSATVSGIVAGSRILIVRTDTSAVLANAIVSGTSYSVNVQTASAIPISVVLRKASAAPYYQEWATTGSIDPVGGFAATANQQQD